MSITINLEKLKYPIGKFKRPVLILENNIQQWISTIENFPNSIKSLTQNLKTDQLNWVYRPDGWNIKQVVHHCADSHMNAFIRFKLALTEDNPHIKPYNESAWAMLIDGCHYDISGSILIIEGLHKKWTLLLKSLSLIDFKKKYFHPESQTSSSLEVTLALYAWHCNHHLEHIKQALNHRNNF